ncbi:hypothetical protein DM02DRAFT_684044 [Periconia macrospinosa]|uniref:F-box domain-containing protein n=1 Tax=Periconia macrospinosa TaxID=97972 RepID=A0A2V1E567_9PLEO|nr:hypothetical protein DM02DRAFT_684044 [Periconia macrospinosa]
MVSPLESKTQNNVLSDYRQNAHMYDRTDLFSKLPNELIYYITEKLDDKASSSLRLTCHRLASCGLSEILRDKKRMPKTLHFCLRRNDLRILNAILHNEAIMERIEGVLLGCAYFDKNDVAKAKIRKEGGGTGNFYFHQGQDMDRLTFDHSSPPGYRRSDATEADKEQEVISLMVTTLNLLQRWKNISVRFGCTFNPRDTLNTLPLGLRKLGRPYRFYYLEDSEDVFLEYKNAIFLDQPRFLDWALYILLSAILQVKDCSVPIEFVLQGKTAEQEMHHCIPIKQSFRYRKRPVGISMEMHRAYKTRCWEQAGCLKSDWLAKRLQSNKQVAEKLGPFIHSITWLELPGVGLMLDMDPPGTHSLWYSNMIGACEFFSGVPLYDCRSLSTIRLPAELQNSWRLSSVRHLE